MLISLSKSIKEVSDNFFHFFLPHKSKSNQYKTKTTGTTITIKNTLSPSRKQNLHSIRADGRSVRSLAARGPRAVRREGWGQSTRGQTRVARHVVQCRHEVLPASELHGGR